MCDCHGGIRQEPPRDTPALPSSWTFLCTVYIASWTGLLNMHCAALRRKREGHELDRLDLPRDAVPARTSGCPSSIRLAAVPARETDSKDATWICLSGQQQPPCSSRHAASQGFDPFSRGKDSGLRGLAPAAALTGIRVSRSAFGPGSVVTAGLESERREKAVRIGPRGRGALGEVLGRRCTVDEASAPRGGALPACTP